ncbi:MAG: glycosyltransferase family A protein [Vicinamibacterales bacterium]
MGFARVSVIVTCFNLGKYLPEAIDSVRAQTFRDFEICVVDDGSTDAETKRVLEQLGSEVVVVRSDNRGLSAGRRTIRRLCATSGSGGMKRLRDARPLASDRRGHRS